MDLHDRSDEELLFAIAKLTGTQRELTALLVAHLAELEERRLHLVAGYASLFEFCTKTLRFSEAEACRRILAARLFRRFPVVYSLLAAGDVNLSTLELLRPRLTAENHEELFRAVAGKSKREVQALLAARYPQPDRPASIRRASIEPLSEASYRVEFTASTTLREKLELCRDLMSHANPSRNLAVVIERAVDLLLADLERMRLGKLKRPQQAAGEDAKPHDGTRPERKAGARSRPDAPSKTPPVTGTRARVSSSVRREVFERDGVRCTYAESGRRCEARAFLELDHEVPKALGGSDDVGNLRVLCRAHNQLAAEQVFGREHIESMRHFRHLRRQRSMSHLFQKTSTATRATPLHEGHPPQAGVFEKVRLALRGMGFRDAEARRAVATVARMHGENQPLELEPALREALLVATAA